MCELVCLPWLISLDAAAYRWVQTLRSCRADYLASLLKQLPLMGLLILGGVPVAVLYLRRQWAEAWRASWVIGGGLFLCELLKTGLERARPSVLTPSLVGNSFPSGHVSAALLMSGVFIFLARRSGWNAGLRHGGTGLCVVLSVLIVWQRVYFGHHWLLDVVGTVLLGAAWLSFGLSRPARLPISRSALAWSVGLLACYPVVLFLPHASLSLPSARTAEAEPVARISFGVAKQHLSLDGAWGAQRPRAGRSDYLDETRRGRAEPVPAPARRLSAALCRPPLCPRPDRNVLPAERPDERPSGRPPAAVPGLARV